jgi:two-component system, chemotaxis family, chemotaxis protein CheY
MPTVLVVDDYAPNHRLMGFVLEQSGYAVISALDGLHALDCLRVFQIDLIVTDLTMPRLDGMGLVEQVRGDTRLCKLPIVMVTASGREADAVRAAGIGVDAFLTKPVESEELAVVVGQLLTREADEGEYTLGGVKRSAA